MCTRGDTVDCEVTVLAAVSGKDKDTVETKPIDLCIASIVQALEAAGIYMYGSCCGHGEMSGDIPLADGRRLSIVRDYRLPQPDLEEVQREWLIRSEVKRRAEAEAEG